MANKRTGKHSASANDFLEPKPVVITSAIDVGTGRAFNNGAINIIWTLPAGSPEATLYTITPSPAVSGAPWTTTGLSYIAQGLTSSQSYTFSIVASNAAGASAPTVTSAATATTAPSSPTSVSVSTGGAVPSGSDRITFAAPSATGGSTVTSYRIVSSLRGVLTTSATSPYDTADPTLPDASADESYTVYVSNANGESAGASTAAIQTFTPPHFPPFFPPYFGGPYFPPYFPSRYARVY